MFKSLLKNRLFYLNAVLNSNSVILLRPITHMAGIWLIITVLVELRRNMSVVLQESMLFSGTSKDNNFPEPTTSLRANHVTSSRACRCYCLY